MPLRFEHHDSRARRFDFDIGITAAQIGIFQAAVAIGERVLCPGCYDMFGSCCLEFGGDDLWAEREKEGADDER